MELSIEEFIREAKAPLAKLLSVDLDQMQTLYDGALRRVMTDLTSTTELRPTVVVDFTDSDCQYSYNADDGSSHGSSLWWEADEEAATVRLADIIQDDALEELWGPTWPPCPEHSHPAQAALYDDQASWICPRTRRPLSRIGSLS